MSGLRTSTVRGELKEGGLGNAEMGSGYLVGHRGVVSSSTKEYCLDEHVGKGFTL